MFHVITIKRGGEAEQEDFYSCIEAVVAAGKKQEETSAQLVTIFTEDWRTVYNFTKELRGSMVLPGGRDGRR